MTSLTMNSESERSVPKGFKLIESGGLTIIRQERRGWSLIPMFVVCLVFNGVFIDFVINFTNQGFELLFLLLYAALSIGATYGFIVMLFNKTDVEYSSMGVRVRTHPIWLGGDNAFVHTNEIAYFTTQEEAGWDNDKYVVSHTIVCMDHANKEHPLITLSDRNQAGFIELTLNSKFNPL